MKAQGTIEYLVILAIVVVVSLIVVGLTTNMVSSPSTQINSSTDKIGNLTSGGITVVEAISDSQGDSLIRLLNNSGETVTLEKIVVGDNETNFSEQLVSGDNKTFSLSDLNLSCPCTENQKKVSCSFDFHLTNSNGLPKKQTAIITTECEQSVQAIDPDKIIGLGEGTLAKPRIINSCKELQKIKNHLDWNFTLGADINCSGIEFDPIDGNFTGTFNGDNHTISNLTIYTLYDQNNGLFEKNSGTISNLIINNYAVAYLETEGEFEARFTGDWDNFPTTYGGTIAGLNLGVINNCSVNGEIEEDGWYYVGGLVGLNDGNITNSTFRKNDFDYGPGGYYSLGALVGVNNGYLIGSTAIGPLEEDEWHCTAYWNDGEHDPNECWCGGYNDHCIESGLNPVPLIYENNGVSQNNVGQGCFDVTSMCLI